MSDFNKMSPFRFWCQKILPLVYDDSLSYYELLCKVVSSLNASIENINNLIGAYESLEKYVNEYFDKLDISKEIDKKLDKMAESGELDEIISKYIVSFDYLNVLEGKKIVVFGDSISDNTFRSYNKWTYYLAEYLKNVKNCTVKNYSTGGYQLSRILTAITSCTETNVDIVILFGGINDYRYSTPLGSTTATKNDTFNGCLNLINQAFQSQFPNAVVYCISPLKNKTVAEKGYTSNYVPLPFYIGCLSERSKKFGWEFIDAYNNAPLLETDKGTWFDSGDGDNYLHPKVEYSPYLCKFILGCIVKGSGIPLGECIEVVDGTSMKSMGILEPNSVFTIKQNLTRVVCRPNSYNLRIVYDISSNSRSVMATLATMTECFAPYFNQYWVLANPVLSNNVAPKNYCCQFTNSDRIVKVEGSNAESITDCSFLIEVKDLYYILNR